MAEHSPNTSELSKPHESLTHPHTHVDNLHFDQNGKHDPRLDVDGIIDPGSIRTGQHIYEMYQEEKGNPPTSSDEPSHDSMSSYNIDYTPDDEGGTRK
jgi:hypothetical protein